MHVRRPLLFVAPLLLASSLFLASTPAAHAQDPFKQAAYAAMETCKNVASARLATVPRAYINVSRASDTGSGDYLVNFRAQPPQGHSYSGFCQVSRDNRLQNFQFDPPSGGNNNNGNNGGGIGGNHGGRISGNDAMRACKDAASLRMPNVPRAYISTYRATDPGNGGYVINFRSQPPNSRPTSGFCNVTWNGKVQNLQFDTPPPPPPPGNGGNQNWGGQTPFDAMRSCKSTVSARFPSVPLAFIQVDQPRVNGGSLLSAFRVNAPNGLHANGTCDVFKNGKVNLTVR